MRLVFALVLGTMWASAGWGQTGTATVTFHMVRDGLAVPDYTFVLHQNGAAEYTAENAAVPNRYGVVVPGTNETVQRLGEGSGEVKKMIALTRSVQELKDCASRRKGVANTGAKTLSLEVMGEKTVVCFYNYSENSVVEELTREFQAMAFTLDQSRKMERDQRFDRLALDGDMAGLVMQVKAGQAMGISWIRGTLQGLVDDPAVLQRVRTQAAKLLEQNASAP